MEMLEGVPEFRGGQGRQYALTFILAVCVVATLAGARNYREIATAAEGICQCQLRVLGAEWDYFTNCYRCPRRTTIRHVLANIDAAGLDDVTGAWLLARARKRRTEDGGTEWAVAVDGKVLKGAWADANGQVTLFSAMLHEEAVTVAQLRVPDGTGEATQVKALTEKIGIPAGETVLVTLDAAHCTRKTAKAIGGKEGWNYLVTVKTDKGALYRQASDRIRPVLGREPGDVMTSRSRGTVKKWSCWTAEAEGMQFPFISQVACVCREVTSLTGEKLSKEVAIRLTSATAGKMSAASINRHTRDHWGIENKSHYIRDTVFREDHNQSWSGNGPHALASLRNLATGLLRLKNTASIKEATELIHMDRTLALRYMATQSNHRHTM
jgi:predicted transposase YbfD/YdcC